MPLEEKRAGKGCVLAAILAAAVLLALNLLHMYWSIIGSQSIYGASWPALRRILVWLAVWLVLAAAAALILRRARTERVMRFAIPIYVAVLIAALAAHAAGHGKWLRIYDFNLYVPALLYLSLLLTAYVVSLYRRLDDLYLGLVILAALVIPFFLAALTGPGMGIILAFTLFLLAVRLCRDRRLSAFWIAGPVIFGVLLLLFLFIRTDFGTLLQTRLAVFLTQGQSDPMGTGWAYSNLIAALRRASLFGGSDYAVAIGDGASIPAFSFFAYEGYEYLPAALVLRFGWAFLLIPAAAALCLPVCLFRLSGLAANSYSRYLSFSVGALFLVRLVLGTVSCFALFLGGCFYPFAGNLTAVAVDVLLLTAALVLSRKEEDLSDRLDRERPTAQFLSYLSDDLQRELTLKEKLLRWIRAEEPDEEEFDDEDFPDLYGDDGSGDPERKLSLTERLLRWALAEDLDDEEFEDEDLFDRNEADGTGGPRRLHVPDRRRSRKPGLSEPEAAAAAEKLEADIAGLRSQIDRLRSDMAALEQDNAELRGLNREWASLLADRTAAKKAARTRVFISYNHLDLQVTEMLCSRLEARGLSCWYADRDIQGGDYAEQIMLALEETKIFVVLVSAASNASEHVAAEVANAFEMKKQGLILMPFILEDVPLSGGLRYRLAPSDQTLADKGPLEEQLDLFADKIAAVMAE